MSGISIELDQPYSADYSADMTIVDLIVRPVQCLGTSPFYFLFELFYPGQHMCAIFSPLRVTARSVP